MADETRTAPAREVTYRVGSRDRGARLDLFLKERIPKMSREGIKEAIRRRVVVRGRGAARPSTLLREGDEVVVAYPAEETFRPGELPAIDILHEDAFLLAVSKPAGLRVHATVSSRGPSLLAALAAQEPIASRREDLRLVHRLDRETSGVVVLARTREAARSLSGALASGEVEKVYTAVVFGEPRRDEGVVDLPLGSARSSAVHIKQGIDRDAGRPARSEYRIVERLRGFAVVEVRPRTGRRHQIRVHMQAIGHPVVGDKLYAARESHHLRFLTSGLDDRMMEELKAERQLLHAGRIDLPHPDGSGRLRVDAPLPGGHGVLHPPPPGLRRMLQGGSGPTRKCWAPECGATPLAARTVAGIAAPPAAPPTSRPECTRGARFRTHRPLG